MLVSSSRIVLWVSSLLLSIEWVAPAQDPGEAPRILCDVTDPANKCPGLDCFCVPDTLEVVFDGASRSVLALEEFVAGTEVVATTMTETAPGGLRQGWSYGVKHEEGVLTVTEVGIAGTSTELWTLNGFDATRWDNVQTCLTERCSKYAEDDERLDGGGWIQAHVLSFVLPQQLPVGRNSLAWARYTLDQDPGRDGTRIELTDRLAARNSPRVDLNVTIDGKSRRWETLIDGSILTNPSGPEEKLRTICDVLDPANECPGADCRCLEDILEITFDGDTQSILEYDAFVPGLPIDVTVVTDARTQGIQAWSYGVAHDEADLTLLSVTTDGTAVPDLLSAGFNSTTMDDVQTCLTEACSRSVPEERRDGGGWLSVIVLSFLDPVTLPVGRRAIAKASYALAVDVGGAGSLIAASDRIAPKNQSRTEYNLTIGGLPFAWTTTIDGWVKRRSGDPGTPFRRGDVGVGKAGDEHPADGAIDVTDVVRILRTLFLGADLDFFCEMAADVNDDGEIQLADAVYALGYLFLGAAEPPPPFGVAGLDATPDALGCVRYP